MTSGQSDAANSDGVTGAVAPSSGDVIVDKWIAKVNLQKILDGTKLGVPLHQSELAAQCASGRSTFPLLSAAGFVQKRCCAPAATGSETWSAMR